MMKIISVDQIYQADQITLEKQKLKSTELMERAGTAIYNWLTQRLKGSPIPIHIFSGIGNNGGDGLVVARLLIKAGYNVKVYIVNISDKRSKDFLYNYSLIKDVTKDWPLLMHEEADFPVIGSEDIVIDAIFGIGLNRPPKGWIKKLIQYLNKTEAYILSIDVPSGLYSNKPLDDPEAVVQATETLTFQTPKLAFFLPETGKFMEGFEVLNIGQDEEYLDQVQPLAETILAMDVLNLYKPRKTFGYKNTYGHALIVAGSYGKVGAAVLSTSAAFRIGAGMLTTFVPKCGYSIMQTALPEAMVITDKEEDFISGITADFEPSAIGIGMGIGKNEATVEAVKKLFQNSKSPLVIDADALNIISENEDVLSLLPRGSILTPHPGELKRLIGAWKDDYEKLEMTKKFAAEHEVVVIIKGSYTITVYENCLYINTTGNPGMGTAGSGDVLTGVITGLVSQGYDALSASIVGVYLHGSAGDIAAQHMGYEALLSGDIVNYLGEAYLELITPSENSSPGIDFM